MQAIYAREPFPQDVDKRPSIMLLGPTPRSVKVKSWRPRALELLREYKFWGYVFVPEERSGKNFPITESKIAAQYRWGWQAIDQARCTMFWIPQSILLNLAALTANIEVGLITALYPKKVVLGFPPKAQDLGYIRQLAQERVKPPIQIHETLEATIKHTIQVSLLKRYHAPSA